jgi:hypothetical protein
MSYVIAAPEMMTAAATDLATLVDFPYPSSKLGLDIPGP